MHTRWPLTHGTKGTTERLNPANLQSVPAALSRICASVPFRKSQRLSSFLCFVVNAALAGNGASIKAYSVAVDGLGMPASFDPERSPLVRVTARRVRQALIQYYNQDGRNDPVLINIPQGGYIPVFYTRAGDEAGAGKPLAPANPNAAVWTAMRKNHKNFIAEINQTRRLIEEARLLIATCRNIDSQ
jgi:hypothetical protein